MSRPRGTGDPDEPASERPGPGRARRGSETIPRPIGRLASSPVFLDQLEDVLLVLDDRLRIEDANRAGQAHFGLTLPDDRGAVSAAPITYGAAPDGNLVRSLAAAGTPWTRKGWHVDAAGRRRFGSTILLPVADGRLAAIWRDETSARFQEESSFQGSSGPAPRPTEAALVHELVGSIAGLQNALALVQQDLEQDADERLGSARDHLDVASRELDRLARFGSNLRKMRSPARPELIPIQVGTLVDEVVAIASPHARARDVFVEVEVDEMLASEHVAEDETWEALKNVLLNAIQHSPAGGEVDLVAKVGGPGIVIEIADRGPGIPASLGRVIYEPFFTNRPEGTGLGLSTARAALTDIGGYVEHVPRDGGGTTFRVAVPTIPSPTS